jgi:polar amino acid transport system substrate-binding protein
MGQGISYAGPSLKITSLDWEPYSSAKMITQGNSVQALRQILKKSGTDLIVEFYPWKRAQRRAKGEGYFGYFPAWPEEVAAGFIASEKIDISDLSIMRRADVKNQSQDLKDICRNHKVGYVSTYVYDQSITKVMKNIPKCFLAAHNEKSLIKMLAGGRFDFALTDSTVMQYLASQLGINDVVVHRTIMKKDLVIAVHDTKENRKKLKKLNKLIKQK